MRKLDETSFKNRNAASYWYRTRNPIRVLMNGLLMMLAKYFPSMMVKRNVFRLIGAKIGKNTTIGARTLIMPGITIGDNVIIAADSLVNKDVANEKVEGGVPIEEISVHLKS